MIRLLKSLINIEISNFDTPLEGYRVALINKLAILTIFVCSVLSILTTVQGLFPQNIFIFFGVLLFALVPFLNSIGHHSFAKNFYLTICVVVLVITSLTAYQAERFNDVENVMTGLTAIAIFLYSGKTKNVICFFLYAILILLKTAKEYYGAGEFGMNYYLTLQNVSVLCFLIIVFAMTFRKSLLMAFEEIYKHEKILYSLIDNIPLYMAMIDRDRRYIMVNKNYVEAFGKSRDQIITSKIEDILPKSILDTHSVFVDRALAGESPEFLEETKMPDGAVFYASGRYVPVKNEDGNVGYVTVYVSDVTKLEYARAELNKANKTKDQLFSIIAHDILSPLNLFQSILNISRDESISREQFFHYQESVNSQLGVLRETISGLLDWARIQLDGINATPRHIDIDLLLRENLQLYQPMVDKKSIDFQLNTSSGLKAWIDENHFKVVIRNLVHNALKYTDENGQVRIDANDADNFIILKISDNGLGMSEKLIQSILKREIQTSEPGTSDEMGTGLGLSLSLGLLEKNNCRVILKSNKDIGTSFEISIPKDEEMVSDDAPLQVI